MEKKDTFTKALAILGTILAWLPLLAPVFFSVIGSISRRRFLFDYLMPAELFLLALAGGLLLLWAALRARSRQKLIGWSLALAVVLLFGSQGLAVVSGLASGEQEAEGFWFALVLAVLAGYILALIAVAVGGVLLLRDLYRRAAPLKSA
ncbi:MAG: hypothetical protein JXB15_09420 [Anaerolineales bacterium]|nr:hypothetical protein [Anaerolineales bacterium]